MRIDVAVAAFVDDLYGRFPEIAFELPGKRRVVRRENDIWQCKERAVGAGRLGVGDIQCGAAELAIAQGVDQRYFVNDRAAGRIDQQGAFFHGSEFFGADEMPGLVGQIGRASCRERV